MESGNRGMKAWYAWSRAGSRPPLRGATRPGCPAFGGASVVCSALAPPALRRPAPPPWGGGPSPLRGFAPGPPVGPSAPLGPVAAAGGSGPLRSLGVAPGVARPVGGPPAPVGAAPSLPRRAPLRRVRVRVPGALAPRPLGPLLGGSGPVGSCRLPPPGGGAALLPPPGLRPFPRRAGSPSPGPCRAARLPPWAAAPPPSGGGWGGCAALFRAAAPSVGVVPVGAVVGALRSSGPPAVLVGCPAALVVGAGGPCHLPKITVKGQDKRPPVGLGAALDGDLQRRQPGGNAARPGLAVTAPVDMVGRTKSKEKPSKKEEKKWKPKRKC